VKSIQAVFFDLDGTLVDTAPDLGYALNLQLQRHGKPVLTDDEIRPFASHGSRGLLGLGFVTNKPRRFTQPLVASMGLDKLATCVVSGDDAPQPKPSPATLLMACAQTGVQPEECVYVGDAERDIQAGKAAGMHTLVALFGYLDASDTPETWGADGLIHQPEDLLLLFKPS
jgi:N-acetyl-D-muramate 6-phosphate phosphatase